MGRLACVILAVYLSHTFCRAETETTYTNALGSKLSWRGPDELETLDYSTNEKPILHLFHRSWCGACKALKKNMKETEDILQDISTKFILIEVFEDNPKFGKEFTPDGKYIPRIIFATPNGTVMDQKNPHGNPGFPYFYSGVQEMKEGMEAVLETLFPKPVDHDEL